MKFTSKVVHITNKIDVFQHLSLEVNRIEFTMLHKGGSDYKLLHISKDKLRLQGALLRNVICTEPAIQVARQELNSL